MSRVKTISNSKTTQSSLQNYISRNCDLEGQWKDVNGMACSIDQDRLLKSRGKSHRTNSNSAKKKSHVIWIPSSLHIACLVIGMINLSVFIHIHKFYSVNEPTHLDLLPVTNVIEESELDYYNIENLELAWKGEVSNDEVDWSAYEKIHIVVAHCDKDLSWLNQFTRGRIRGLKKSIETITVFSKCGNKVTGVPKYSKVINLPNVGRCDHTYAHWMAQYSDDVNNFHENDVIFFIKDNPYQTRNGHWRMFNEMLGQAITNGFSCALRANYMIQLRELDPSVFHYWNLVKTFNYKTTYQRQGGQELQSNPFGSWGVELNIKDQAHVEPQIGSSNKFASEYLNLESWRDAMGINPPKTFMPVCYGGVFATTIKRIRIEADLWPRIEKSLSRTDNLEEGHFAERSWASALMKPLSDEGIQAIESRLDDTPCQNYHVPKLRQYFKDRCGTLIHNKTLHY